MPVIAAKIQTVEEIYRQVWTAVVEGSPSRPPIRAGAGCYVHTAWAGIEKDSFVCSVISTAGKVRADSIRLDHQQTGAAS
jgi:hypothetical protein